MNSVFKNFIYVLEKYKASSILNILGLTLAFAAFLMISIEVYREYSFESCHSLASRIYRVDGIDTKTGETWSIHSQPFTAAVIHSSPHILKGTLINPYIRNFYITANDADKTKGFKEDITICNTDIVDIFNFDMLEGDKHCLSDPQKVLLPESIARKIFGNKPAVGKSLHLNGYLWTKQDRGSLVVGGVFKDFPENTQLENTIYTAINENDGAQDWSSSNYFCYILLDEDTQPEDIVSNFNKHFDWGKKGTYNPKSQSIQLIPVESIFFMNSDPSGKMIKSGNPQKPLILISIGLLIICIAIINYTNFNMALAPIRVKSINARKIFGASHTGLRIGIIVEGILFSLLAYLLAAGLVCLLSKNHWLPFVPTNLLWATNKTAFLLTLAIALLTGFIASIRPAFYITLHSPAMVLKRNFGLSHSEKRSREWLIGFQLFISIALIIAATFIYIQNKYMRNFALGYDTTNVSVVELSEKIAKSQKNTLIAALKTNPDIEDVAFSLQKIGASDNYRTWGGTFKGENIGFYSLGVSHNILDVLKISLPEGKKPDETTDRQKSIYYVINKGMSERYDIHPGDIIHVGWMKRDSDSENGRVLGVVDNIKFRSLRYSSGENNSLLALGNSFANMAFVFNDWQVQTYSYIRIKNGADIKHTMQFIEKTIYNLDPAYPVKIESYDEIFNDLYTQERATALTIGCFSLLAVIISIVGVFGLVMFECQFKRKEVSIRKAMGATSGEILILFNKIYLKIFLISFLLAVPVGYYIVKRWLTNFAYKTDIEWWVFAGAGLSVLLILLATITLQSHRAAIANPVDALKNE